MEKAYKLEFGYEQSGSLFVNSCGCSKTEPLHSFGPAVKPYYVIHYILSGKGVFTINGKTYHLEAGYGFYIKPDEMAFYQADEEDPWTYVWVGFRGNQAEEILKSIGLSLTHPVFRSNMSDEFYKTVKDMMEHNTASTANILRRNGQLDVFLSIIAESADVIEREEQDKANNYVQRAVEYIQSNFCNPIKVTDVANYVCINRSYLYTLFQDYLKVSPQQFLTIFRLTKAAELLQSTSYSIESIALSCGYSDALVFTKAFRQMKGVSPSVFRKEMKNGGSKNNREQLQQVEAFINDIIKGQNNESEAASL